MSEKVRKTIAVVCGNVISPYASELELMEGFKACAKEKDVNLVFLTGPHIPRYCKDILTESFAWDYNYQFHTIYGYVHYIKPDAVIVAYGLLSQLKHVPDIDEFVKSFAPIPCLVMGDRVADPSIPYLTSGNYNGMKENVKHLIEVHGYRKIGFVAGPERNFDSNRRIKAYKDAMAEAGLTVEDSYIIRGNYTEAVDKEVEWLLDANPNLEAIVFANDMMAKGGYRVCAKRKLVIGKDIAITGYDDRDVAKSMEPKLTSVAHSNFLFSYRAVENALKLCNGETPESMALETQFRGRASCGCKVKRYGLSVNASMEELDTFIEKRVAEVTEELFSEVPYEKDKRKYRLLLEMFFNDLVEMIFGGEQEGSFELLTRYLKKMCENTFVSKTLLLEYCDEILMELIECSSDKQKHAALRSVSDAMQRFIHAEELNALNTEIINSNRKNWFIPSFTMDLINNELDFKERITQVMNRLRAMGSKSTYLFFFDKPVVHKKGEQMEYPKKISLVAHYNDKEMVCYKEDEFMEVLRGNGFTEQFPQDRPHSYTAFPLFSGDEQYGMVMCEAKQSEYMLMLICSMQLGSLRRIINLNRREQTMRQELEEKNRILSVISANDELSRLLNRRGFMEQAIFLIKRNIGKKACIIFADIDHLKEINDSFGHAAGDFAIITVADYLRACMPKDAPIARIGGDEYVALVILDENLEGGSEGLRKKLVSHMREFNNSCDQPFYVEMSAGIYEFVCEADTDIPEILKHSDEVLYEQKKKRRVTIRKF